MKSTDLTSSRYSHSGEGKTEFDGRFLKFYKKNPILPADDDMLFVVTPEYENLPDLISFKFYGTERYMWVILLRNNIANPLLDITTGKRLFIPSQTRLNSEILL